MIEEDKDFLRQDNNYRSLKAFQKAECIYDVTYYFAHKYLKTSDRTIDQMVQAARSGKQNLAEGNIDGITSREIELKLTMSIVHRFTNCCWTMRTICVSEGWSNGSMMTLAVFRHAHSARLILTLLSIGRKSRSVPMRQ